MSDTVIEIRDLVVRAGKGGREILSVPCLSVARGEVLAVMGPNGAGKTTLLERLTGFGRFSGEVCVLGQSVGRLGWVGLSRLRRRVAYMPQLLAPPGELPLTIREVVSIGRSGIAGLGRRLGRADWQIVDEWLGRLGLAELAGNRFADCSGGEQRRALIAKAMTQQPDILLLDEPTANLDLAGREKLVATLQSLYDQTGVTIVLVCHELEVLPPCCRRVLLLEAGQAVADDQPGAVFSPQHIAELYGADVRLVHSGRRWAVVPPGAAEAGL